MEIAQITPCNSQVTTPDVSRWRVRGFPLAFIALAALLLLLTAHLPENLLDLWRDIVMEITRILGAMTGLSVINHDDIMTVNGFEMRIISHCTAIHYIVIITSAILLSSWHTLRYRILGLAGAILLLVLFNSLRLLLTGLAGAVSPLAFSFVHDYLWVTIFILLTFGVWLAWDQGVASIRSFASLRMLEIIISCTLCQLLLMAGERQVGGLITWLATAMTALTPGAPQLIVTWEAGRVIFTQGATVFSGLFMAEMVTLAVYAGLVAVEIRQSGAKAVVRSLAGGLLLLLGCAALVALCGSVVVKFGAEAAALYLWVAQGVLLALPVGIWLRLKEDRFAVAAV